MDCVQCGQLCDAKMTNGKCNRIAFQLPKPEREFLHISFLQPRISKKYFVSNFQVKKPIYNQAV